MCTVLVLCKIATKDDPAFVLSETFKHVRLLFETKVHQASKANKPAFSSGFILEFGLARDLVE